MDDSVCASCGRGLSLEEIERGSFKQLAGRVYCADCVAKMRRVGPTVCPRCGAHDTPLYNGATYVCRKCGAELPRPTAAAPARAKAPARTRPRPVKKCPYCGAVLPAESLKCRYCGSSLTREARDLGTLTRQNLRQRFWLGCLLSASVFLFCILVYMLAQRPRAGQPKAAAPLTAAPAAPKPASADGADGLLTQLAALQQQVARLETELAQAKRGRAPAVAVAPRTATPPRPGPPPAVPKPAPKPPEPAPKEPKPKEPAAGKPDPAALAAAAYPGFHERLTALRSERKYAEAMGACRQFVAVHLGTPQAEQVAADQRSVRAELEAVRDDHVGRFRKALADGDLTAARAVAAELERYQAPELRDDRRRMLAEVLAAQQQPQRDRARYLTQWKSPPHIQRLVAQLHQRDDTNAQAAAARELGRHHHAAALGPLIQAADDPDWYVVNLVVKALAEVGDPVALPDVARKTKAFYPGVYAAAAEACHVLAAADRKDFADAWRLTDTKAVARDIAEALRVPKEESTVTSGFRIHLIEALVLLDAKEAVPDIRALLKTRDDAVKAAAAAAVKKLTRKHVAARPPAPAEKPKPKPPEPPKAPKPKTAGKPEPSPPKKPEPTRPPQPKAPAKPQTATSATVVEAPEPEPAGTPMPTPPSKPRAPKPTPAPGTSTPPRRKPKPAPPKPAPPPSTPAGALPGTVEPSPDGKALAIRLPSRHGLAKGDKVELAAGGRPLCVCKIEQAEGTRVVATILELLDKTPPAPDTPVTLTRAE